MSHNNIPELIGAINTQNDWSPYLASIFLPIGPSGYLYPPPLYWGIYPLAIFLVSWASSGSAYFVSWPGTGSPFLTYWVSSESASFIPWASSGSYILRVINAQSDFPPSSAQLRLTTGLGGQNSLSYLPTSWKLTSHWLGLPPQPVVTGTESFAELQLKIWRTVLKGLQLGLI